MIDALFIELVQGHSGNVRKPSFFGLFGAPNGNTLENAHRVDLVRFFSLFHATAYVLSLRTCFVPNTPVVGDV